MKLTLLAGILCVLAFNKVAAAQGHTSDSLSKSLYLSAKIQSLIVVSFSHINGDDALALEYMDSAFRKSLQLGDSSLVVKTGRIKGQLLRRLDRLAESTAVLLRILPTTRRLMLKDECKLVLNALAVDYTYMANYDLALQYNFESLEIRENDGDESEISIALMNIGLVYFKLNNYNRAIEYYKKSLRLKEKIDDRFDQDRLLINMGLCYNELSCYRDAIACTTEAFKVSEGAISPSIQMEGNLALGVSFLGLGKLHEAETKFLNSLAIAERIRDTRIQLENLIYLGRLCLKGHRNDNALLFLKKSENMAIGTQYNEARIDTYRELATIYLNLRQFEKAAEYQEKYIGLNEKTQAGRLNNIAKIQLDFETRLNLKTIAAQDEILRLREYAIRNHKITIAMASAVAILFLVLTVVLSKRNLVNKRISKLLEQRVRARTQLLEESLIELRRGNHGKNVFLTSVSRDLRSHLLTMHGLLALAGRDVNDALVKEYIERLMRLQRKLSAIADRLQPGK